MSFYSHCLQQTWDFFLFLYHRSSDSPWFLRLQKVLSLFFICMTVACVCVCVCVHIVYTYTHVRVCVCVCVCLCMSIHACMFICVHIVVFKICANSCECQHSCLSVLFTAVSYRESLYVCYNLRGIEVSCPHQYWGIWGSDPLHLINSCY